MATTIRLILGDQLNYQHSWYQTKDDEVLYVMMEVLQETNYVQHHIQKILGFFAAMRAFAEHLKQQGHQVLYIPLDDPENFQSIPENLSSIFRKENIQHLEYQLPDEYRLDQQLKDFVRNLHISHQVVDSEHFLTKRNDLQDFFKDKKTFLMESFYRKIRKDFAVLMDSGNQPTGGKWNFDAENRKKYDFKVPVPQHPDFSHDLTHLYDMIQKMGVKTIGFVNSTAFPWPVNRAESLEILDFFVNHCLPYFGTYEDAMEKTEPFLFHSRLSFALNTKMLSPLEVIQKAIGHWEQNQDAITLAQIEGFVRQILGWREYMRGVYWAKMPEYKNENFFNHQRALPNWFWTGDTKMNCLHHAIAQSLEYAYAHHIQRLMVIGNFALLSGIHPDAVDTWYLGIYQDAIEWVQITNTRGMSQYADGGLIATKPYVSSANYIDKMSSYCKGCHYDKKKKTGEGACPFNSLYWNFYIEHQGKLSKNPRIGMVYVLLNKMDLQEKMEISKQAQKYLDGIENL